MRWRGGLVLMSLMVSSGCESRPPAQVPSPDLGTTAPSPDPFEAVHVLDMARSAGDEDSEREPPDALDGLVLPELSEPVVCEEWLVTHASQLVELPDEYDALVPRVSHPAMHRISGLIHEGHNVAMRGEGHSDGVFEDAGPQIARRWRTLGCGMGGMFVLRDSLFSQQDHALAHDAFALMLPPNWVTRAAWLTRRGELIVNVAHFELNDDAAWAAASSAALFGSFPESESLGEAVTYPVGGEDATLATRARHGRAALGQLHDHVEAMRRAAPFGWRAVSRAGAARIAWSDRAYFGAQGRRELVIPVFVEHPNAHELEEGKGMVWAGGDAQVDQDVVAAVTHDVYRARLRDGALAVERYDLSQSEDRARAISLLEALIPDEPGEPDTLLWLWVNGPLDEKKKLQGEPPLPYMEVFLRELETASIDQKRLRMLGKPTVQIARGLRGAGAQKALHEALMQYEEAGFDGVSIDQSATWLKGAML